MHPMYTNICPAMLVLRFVLPEDNWFRLIHLLIRYQ